MLMIITYYKLCCSLNCQGVWLGQFIKVEIKWPGSIHDARVFANCNIKKPLQMKILKEREKHENMGLQTEIESDDHLLYLFLLSFYLTSLHI